MFSVISVLLLTALQDVTESRAPTPATEDTVPPAVRSVRDRMFTFFSAQPLKESLGNSPLTTRVTRQPNPDAADSIILGTITSIDSRLTPNGGTIYSEYHVQVHQACKPEARTIDVLEIGGAVVDADGRQFRQHISGLGPELETNREYTMFLSYNRPAKCCQYYPWR